MRRFRALIALALVCLLPSLTYAQAWPAKPVRMIVPFAAGGGTDVVARPGELTYPSAGVGNASHLAMELFALSTGTRFLHVPYSGTGPAALALLAGHVHLMFNNVQTTMPHVAGGSSSRSV